MPQLVTVHTRFGGRRRRLFVPVVPVVLVLSPLLVIALVGGLIACVWFRVSPVGALRGLGSVVWALPGVQFDLDDGETALRVVVR